MVLFALSLKYKSDICHILDTQQYVSGTVRSRCIFSWCFVDIQLSVLRLGPCTLCMKHECSIKELHPALQRVCFSSWICYKKKSEFLKQNKQANKKNLLSTDFTQGRDTLWLSQVANGIFIMPHFSARYITFQNVSEQANCKVCEKLLHTLFTVHVNKNILFYIE